MQGGSSYERRDSIWGKCIILFFSGVFEAEGAIRPVFFTAAFGFRITITEFRVPSYEFPVTSSELGERETDFKVRVAKIRLAAIPI
jgi:hypothetical protein